jgi:hypothetical protein
MAAEPPGQPPAGGPPTEPTRPLRASVAPRAPVPPPVDRVVEVPPVYPADPSWSDNPWPVLLVALLALIVGGLLGYLIGNKGESSSGSQNQPGPAVTQTVTHSSTVVQPKTVERTVTAPAPTNTVNEERRVEAETALRKSERENERLKRELESTEGG